MKADEEEISRIENALLSARRYRETERMSPRLKSGIMRDIRAAAAPRDEVREPVSLRVVWRFAATASLVAVLVLFYTFGSNLGAEYEAAMFFGDDILIAGSLDLL
ncbi:MAG TPA: hypothetical protein PK250_04830 [Syntrophobacter fumaroxidans]|nr:hypothetical protein [Syntrophobacter fumaroxidans]